jgi:hypothetical protein
VEPRPAVALVAPAAEAGAAADAVARLLPNPRQESQIPAALPLAERPATSAPS